MRISFCKIVFLNYLLTCAKSEEPHCSKYDFEEKVLEKMVRMEFQMERMKSEMEQIVKTVDRQLNEMVEKQEKHTLSIKTTQEKFSETVEALQNKTSEIIETKLKELQILKDQIVTPTVAFKARLNAHTAAPAGQVIVFPVVLFNEGDAYNSKKGKFTATTNGTYLFTIAFCVLHNKYLYVDIMVDGVSYTKTNIYGDYNNDCFTADTVAVLKAGQSVWVQPSGSASGNIIYPSTVGWNTFSGVLLQRYK
ncbi:complement C1q and tumor necrosis factor-related protein 9B-like [Ruditapes philippinarum]|uniref:complement C1q and tumor necrosis factor-related protein 9B-like n=1 Tax=Ruditapes philippinarum TaxID=129788 RepID=UPI00295B3C8B|nr:complement C1q and tumor necrosis factor-related protein 9B-like [Ruditapes philippinarum]